MFARKKATDEQRALLETFHKYTEQFISPDKIVIANPMYNSMIPAELKTWIDTLWTVARLSNVLQKVLLHWHLENSAPTPS